MTVLLLARSFPPAVGGLETYVAELFRRVSEPVMVVAPNRPGAETFDAAYPHPVRRYWYPWESDGGKLPLASLAATAVRPALLGRISVVVSEQVQTAAVGVVIGRALGVPHVVFAYGMELSPLRMRRMKEWAFRSSARVIGISRFARERVEQVYGVPPSRTAIVAPGIEPRRFSSAVPVPRWPARSLGPTLMTLGRLDPTQRYKGYDRLLRLTAALVKEFPGVRCIIAGDGPDRTWLQAIAQSLGISDRANFPGYVQDAALPELFAEADLFVLASGESDAREMRVEGYGIVLAEAAAAGVPTIAYRVGGVGDVVQDGVTGVLTEPEEHALFVATRDLLRNHDRRRRMGLVAAELAAKRLGWDRSVTTLVSTLADVRQTSSISRAS